MFILQFKTKKLKKSMVSRMNKEMKFRNAYLFNFKATNEWGGIVTQHAKCGLNKNNNFRT